MADVAASQSTLVAQFASTRLGQQVGDGQCFALGDQALRSISARSAADFGTVTPTADYVWGREIPLAQARAGDLVQFKNYRFDETITTDVAAPDGSSSSDVQTRSESRPHHTAIVSSVGSNGEVQVYEQNVAGQMLVQHNWLLFTTVTIGPTTTTAADGTTTTVTRTITVTGTAKFYRAQTR